MNPGVSIAEIRAAYPALALLALDAQPEGESEAVDEEPKRAPRREMLRLRPPLRKRRPAMR